MSSLHFLFHPHRVILSFFCTKGSVSPGGLTPGGASLHSQLCASIYVESTLKQPNVKMLQREGKWLQFFSGACDYFTVCRP